MVAQFAAALASVAVLTVLPEAELPVPWLQGLFAAMAARLLGLPWWWWAISFFFPPAAWGMMRLEIPPSVHLIAFGGLAAIYWGAVHTRVPLHLSGRGAWQALERLLPKEGCVLDLGSGLGGPLLWLARRHPELSFVGIEAAPLPYFLSRLRALHLPNLRLRLGSFWQEDLSSYGLVFAYLSPAAMPRLWEKVRREMRPGSTFASLEFSVPGVDADETIALSGRLKLYVWQF